MIYSSCRHLRQNFYVARAMDYSIAIAHLKQADPILSNVIEQVGPCTLYEGQHPGDLFAALTRSILYQQLSGKAAAAIHRRFLQLYDQAHPTPTDVLNTPDDLLRGAGISRPKIVYLKDLAQKVEAFPQLEALNELDDETIIQMLTAVKGIGRWTVQMLLMFRMHRWDVLPVDDLGIRAAMRRLYDLPDLPDKKTVLQIGAPWQPYRTVASWYLWQSLEV